MPSVRFASRCLLIALLIVFAACSNGRGSLEEQPPSSPPPPQTPPPQPAQDTFTIGGSVTGLAGGSVVLQNNGGNDLSVTGDGPFTFSTRVANAAAYAVTVLTQPASPPQTCNIANGTGSVSGGNVTSVTVTCTSAPMYAIGGTVSGLTGTGLVLQNNAGDTLPINANGPFVFANRLANAATYNVAASAQPSGQNCVIRNNTGTIANADVANVEVACAANQFTVGGSVTGLSGTGLILQLNDANDLSIVASGAFAFAVPVTNGNAYTVKVKAQPSRPTQECTVTNATGTVAGANVTNVTIACVTRNFTIGGTVSGLAGPGLVLRLNGANDLPIPSNGSFTFSTPLPSGTSYVVKVFSEPRAPKQTCTVAQAEGIVGGANVANVVVTCATESFAIRGQVRGLAGSGLRLRLNGANEMPIATNGEFRFGHLVSSGARYDVTVAAHPATPTQACSVANGGGVVGAQDVTDIVVTCTTSAFAVGGTIENLSGMGLQLANNGEVLSVSANGTFSFPTAVPSGSGYSVTVVRQPDTPVQQCTVAEGAGVVGAGNVTTVRVSCVTSAFTVGGEVSGLLAAGLVLQNNGADNLAIAANGPFTFATPLLSGQPYSVTVLQNATGQLCFVQNGAGTVGGANVTTPSVVCVFGGG